MTRRPRLGGRRRGRIAQRDLTALESLLDHAPIGVAMLDRNLRFVRANEELNRISGRDAEDVLGKTLDDAIQRPELSVIARSVLTRGEPVFGVDVSGVTVDGRAFNALANYYPVRSGDEVIGVGVIVRDVTAEIAAEEQRRKLLERVTRLQQITASLAAARTTDDVVRVVLDDVRDAASAAMATVLVIVDGRPRVVGTAGIPNTIRSWWRSADTRRRSPFLQLVQRGELVLVNGDELAERWPDVVDLLPAREALAVLPMLDGTTPAGAVVLHFDRRIRFDEGDEAFLTAVSTQCGEALRRARLHESEASAHAAALNAAVRTAYLAEASDVLASSLDWKETLHRVAELAVPRLADFAAAFVVDDGDIAALEIATTDPTRGETVRRLMQTSPEALSVNAGLGALAHVGQAVLIPDLAAGTSRAEELLSGVGFQSLVAVPMRVRDRLIGMIVMATDRPRSLVEDDLALATELATRAAQAIVNAELFRERSHVAATLQASLLPPATPIVPGLEVATRFFAVGEGIDVGGDFYDVFRMGTRAAPADTWAVVIGDVRGKGTEAASISGAARHAIRAAALHERSPAAILTLLNELLLVTDSDDAEPRFCTAVVAAVEPGEDRARLALAVGGHPAPLVLRADGTTEAIEEHGSLLGVVEDAELTDVHVELHRGDALVLFTDGVTERHAGSRFFDEEGLVAVLARCVGFTAPALAERIETASRAFLEDAPRDDLAVVVIRVPGDVATSSGAATDLPDDLTAPHLARRFVLAALVSMGAEAVVDTACLLASELVTNAVIHGRPPLRITVEPAPAAVRVTVSDGSTDRPIIRIVDAEDTSGRGVQLVETLSDRWGVDVHDPGKTVWFELAT